MNEYSIIVLHNNSSRLVIFLVGIFASIIRIIVIEVTIIYIKFVITIFTLESCIATMLGYSSYVSATTNRTIFIHS